MLKLLGLLLALFVAWTALVLWAQRPMLFPAPAALPGAGETLARVGGESVWLDLPFGRVESWLLPAAPSPSPTPLLIYAHGNGELIDYWAEGFDALRAAGVNVLLVEYPGYGRSEGQPSEASIRATLLVAYDRFARDARIDPNKIVVYGRSLGGGAVAQLAAMRPVRAMVLESTFTSVADIARGYGVPRWLVRDPFDNHAIVTRYPGPLLVLHGTRDAIIPVSHGRALADAHRQAELHEFPCGHNDCEPQWELVRTFLERAGVLSGEIRRLP